MALIVQKYGGTSVGTIDRIRNVAARIKRTVEEGNQVVAVVSAMGGVTDKLIGMAKEFCEEPSEREMDVLLSTGEQQSIALVRRLRWRRRAADHPRRLEALGLYDLRHVAVAGRCPP